MFCHLQHASIHRQIVLSGGNNQVGPPDQALLVNLVMMEQDASRRFRCSHALKSIGFRFGANVFRQYFRVVQQLLQAFDAVQNFDQPSLMVVK